MSLEKKIQATLPAIGARARQLLAEHGDEPISQVTVSQVYGGLRGVRGLVCDTSSVDPDRGLIIRGHPVGELAGRLPEEIFYLLCTGTLPDAAELKQLQNDLQANYEVPAEVWEVLRAMPEDSHPMTMFNTAVLVMQGESRYVAERDDVPKNEHWRLCLEDALMILGRLPAIAAGVYRIRFGNGSLIEPDTSLDLAESYAAMMGIEDPEGAFADLMRLYLVLHSDHESGNVSAHTAHLVGSAGSDLYYSLSAALNGLAGPLHGLANQECLKFVLEVNDTFGGVPSDAALHSFVSERLAAGKVIPGYGHAVLRCDDPRFTSFIKYGEKICRDEKVFQTVQALYRVVPPALIEQGKAKDPHPNVDAASGSLLYHFGIREFSYYTVLFGFSRAMGIAAQYILDKALGAPIERPKSVTTEWIAGQVQHEVAGAGKTRS
ncbi:MAG TPA: citrate (Si)-synthase [Candidatus Saccharimonadales bacterium]|nr:citrate (Si)-synthase [Candidatus Saccharimonadales bacterium]